MKAPELNVSNVMGLL